MQRDDWVTSIILRFFTATIVSPMPVPFPGVGVFFCKTVTTNREPTDPGRGKYL